MQGIQSKKFGGEDFGSTLEELKKLAPHAVTLGSVEFNGPARKVGAILSMAAVGGELIAEIERLAVDAERFDFLRSAVCDDTFGEKLQALTVDIDSIEDPSAEQFNEQLDRAINAAKDAGLWPIKEQAVQP